VSADYSVWYWWVGASAKNGRTRLLLYHTAFAQEVGQEFFSLLVYPAGSSKHLMFRFKCSQLLMPLAIADRGSATHFGGTDFADSELAATGTLKVADDDGRLPVVSLAA